MSLEKSVIHSPHFQLERVANGVYAAIAINGTGSLGNAGFVDMGDSTLVFDTMFTPAAASDLLKAAERITGKPVQYVVNSHHHGDHTFGNQVFIGAQIIATTKIRQQCIDRNTKMVEELKGSLSQLEETLRAFEAKIDDVTDERRKQQMREEVACDRHFVAAIPSIEIVLPAITFDEKLTIHGSKRSVELLTYGGGHTPSDLIMLLQEEKILFAGDLVQQQTHTMLKDGNPEEWVQILNKIEQLPIEKIVPGHGAVSTLQELHEVREYITELISLSEELASAKASTEEIVKPPMPAKYQEWNFLDMYERNLEYLMTRNIQKNE